MNQLTKITVLIALFVFTAVTVQAFPWTRDFYDQMSPKAQDGNILNAPNGAVTTEGKNYNLSDDQEAGRQEARKLKNPVPNDPARGKVTYERFCMVCHGSGVAGEPGPVGKKFEDNIMPPTELVGDYVQSQLSEGEIFYVITKGGRIAMPSYGDLVPEEDRWHIVNYIRNELKNKGGN